MRVLITGWFSFMNGEATAGDVGSAWAVGAALRAAGIAYEIAWSPGFQPGGPSLDDAEPERYTHLVFCCGPAHGNAVRALHERYRGCVRVAVGVSVIDPDDPAVRGFDAVIARDRPDGTVRPDLAYAAPWEPPVPVVGVSAAPGQPEYGARGRHGIVHEKVAEWLVGKDCARVPLDTRLDTRDWLHCATTGQFDALVRRVDLVITTRLHGLVFALRNGVPALAVDPVAGGGKVSAQARIRGWPVLTLGQADAEPGHARLDELWDWCLSPAAREALAASAGRNVEQVSERLVEQDAGRDGIPATAGRDGGRGAGASFSAEGSAAAPRTPGGGPSSSDRPGIRPDDVPLFPHDPNDGPSPSRGPSRGSSHDRDEAPPRPEAVNGAASPLGAPDDPLFPFPMTTAAGSPLRELIGFLRR